MDFQMSDIKSTKEGDNQSGYYTRTAATPASELTSDNTVVSRRPTAGDAAIWGGRGGMNMSNLLRGNVFRSVAGEAVGLNLRDAGNLTGPRTASYIPDHQNPTIRR
jgi:hypothetical protein